MQLRSSMYTNLLCSVVQLVTIGREVQWFESHYIIRNVWLTSSLLIIRAVENLLIIICYNSDWVVFFWKAIGRCAEWSCGLQVRFHMRARHLRTRAYAFFGNIWRSKSICCRIFVWPFKKSKILIVKTSAALRSLLSREILWLL